MEILHTPWRRKYVVGARETRGCLFCDLLANPGSDAERLILHRGTRAFLLLNLFPYTPGHVMAIPYRHVASTLDLQPDEFEELLILCGLSERLLRDAYGCQSVHIGSNLGEAAGAGVPGHLHFHIVEWPEQPLFEACKNDEVAPEAVTETYERLSKRLPKMLEKMGDLA
jgi:ATP adenylyltransferase